MTDSYGKKSDVVGRHVVVFVTPVSLIFGRFSLLFVFPVLKVFPSFLFSRLLHRFFQSGLSSLGTLSMRLFKAVLEDDLHYCSTTVQTFSHFALLGGRRARRSVSSKEVPSTQVDGVCDVDEKRQVRTMIKRRFRKLITRDQKAGAKCD